MALVMTTISWGYLSEPLCWANNTSSTDASLASARSCVVHASVSHRVPPEPGTGGGLPCSSMFPLCFRRDGRLTAGDELLMINGQSLVGLSHQDAVALLRSAAGLVQLVVASKVRSSPWWSPERTSTSLCKCCVERGSEIFLIGNHACAFAPLNLTCSYGKCISGCHKSVAN